MNAPIHVGQAAHDAMAELLRTQSLQLDAARERITELEALADSRLAELAAKDRTIAEQRALLARAGSLSERFNDPMQGDGEAVA